MDKSSFFYNSRKIFSPLNNSPLYCGISIIFIIIPVHLLDLLEPGCEGVVKNIDSVPLKNFKEAFEYIVDVGNQYYEEEMQGEWDEDYSDPQGLGEFDGYGEDWRTAGRPGEDGHMTEGGGDYEPPLRDEL